jgi:hypothetical protein
VPGIGPSLRDYPVHLVLTTWSPCASGVRMQRLPYGDPTALEWADIAQQHTRGKEDDHRTPHVKDPELYRLNNMGHS